MNQKSALPGEVTVLAGCSETEYRILTPNAISFLMELAKCFTQRRDELIYNRVDRQRRIDQGELPDFLSETRNVRERDWSIASLPSDLLDRRVEITGPASDRKMVINALNSGAKVFMADLEDSNSPNWENCIQGQIHLRDAIRRQIDFVNEVGKEYKLQEKTAVLFVRPRGWHLDEKHFLIDGKPIPASLFDFGLYFYHNALELLARGTGPYFYLPKLESHLEARLWNDVFVFAQDYMEIPRGTVKATVLIETIMAAFEMDEILYELRDHSAGLNCGRWDYIFSYIKKLSKQAHVILPDRSQVTMTVPFMRDYTLLTVKTCHRRNAPAIGGMAAQIPVKGNPSLHQEAMDKVKADKEREASDGHDGTWVAHPALVPIAKEVFDRIMPTANQYFKQRPDVEVVASDLLAVPEGTITEDGLRMNIRVGVQYMEAWLRGFGAVALNYLMEDVATAEISRAQVWQWIHHDKGILEDGRKITAELFQVLLEEELLKIKMELGEERYIKGRYQEATQLFSELTLRDEFEEFLTVPAYEILT
ncbi:malate synthase [Thermoactinomyces sp. DSM 45891]|uniref:malate synthase A n=1 Tax=Thermoactinomyces sp. DSM 45891 TaxID=1761907 RepID=UPI00091ACAB7|nr:malate synthase A [Thermoactinomyces sp. DSM 45891]SFX33596.1 malate synthase [Thermoactinomyces sp. DSM 45891]